MFTSEIITPYLKNLIQNATQDDIFIQSGSDIFPASSIILKTMTFFKNIFADCQFPLHESKPLIVLEGFDFLNKQNIMNLHNYVRSRMVFAGTFHSSTDKPKIFFDVDGPKTASEQVNFLLLLDYLIGQNQTEKMEFIQEIEFEPDCWKEFLYKYPRLLQFFSKEKTMSSLNHYSCVNLSVTVRKLLNETYNAYVYTKSELDYHFYSSPDYIYKVSSSVLYKIKQVQGNTDLMELIEEEKIHSSIKVLVVSASVYFYTESDKPLSKYPNYKFSYDKDGLLCTSDHTYYPIKNSKTNLFSINIQGETFLIFKREYKRNQLINIELCALSTSVSMSEID
jgi:hypothetical protein